MKGYVYTFGILLLVLICPSSLLAKTLNVPGSYKTIQKAINAAHDGDVVIVAKGLYVENVRFTGRDITVRSTAPTSATVVLETVIDGGASGTVVVFAGVEGSKCTISGFTITRGRSPHGGGGISGNGTHATISYNRITTNSAVGIYDYTYGGGLSGCDGVIKNNLIAGIPRIMAGGCRVAMGRF